MKHLEYSDTCDVFSYDYNQEIAVRISSKADHELAGKVVMGIPDSKELVEILKFLKESGLKIPI